eukprot:7532397-Heterocapsa_arctica.AAC.1
MVLAGALPDSFETPETPNTIFDIFVFVFTIVPTPREDRHVIVKDLVKAAQAPETPACDDASGW